MSWDVNSCNLVILTGHISKEPIFKKVKDEKYSICRFSLATNEEYYDKNDEKQNHAEFHFICAWSRWADFTEKYLSKGRQIQIIGKLRNRYYPDNEGVKRRITEVHVDRIIPLGKREDYFPKENKEREPGEDPY